MLSSTNKHQFKTATVIYTKLLILIIFADNNTKTHRHETEISFCNE